MPQISPPINWLRAVRGFMIWPAAKAPSSRGTRISWVHRLIRTSTNSAAEGVGDLVRHLRAADHPHLALVHGAERIHRRTFGLPLAVFLDHADAERIEGALVIHRAIAFRGLGDRGLAYADRFLRLVD